jgi:hypothetical protein
MMALLLPWPRRAAGTSDEERSTLLLLPSGCPERMATQWESGHCWIINWDESYFFQVVFFYAAGLLCFSISIGSGRLLLL